MVKLWKWKWCFLAQKLLLLKKYLSDFAEIFKKYCTDVKLQINGAFFENFVFQCFYKEKNNQNFKSEGDPKIFW